MSFFAATLGIGEHGSACILLDRGEFFAGDVLAGRVRLSVTTRIDRAKPIRMEIIGRETLAYDEEEVHRVTMQPRAGDADSGPHEKEVRRVHHEEFVYTMLSDAIILDVPARAYAPGVYEFPFEYQLPCRGLVPSFEFQASRFGTLTNVRAHAAYELSLRLPLEGRWKSDICHTCHPTIREDPSLKAPCRVTESRALPVYFFFFCLKGNCDVTATLEQNVVPLGGVARIEVLIDNDSTQRVSHVTTTLHQTVTLNERRSSRDHTDAPPNVTRKIATKKFSGVDAGEELRASLCQPMVYDKKGSQPLMPTMRSHFLSFDYELTVRCRQAWCYEDPTVIFPIVLTTKAV